MKFKFSTIVRSIILLFLILVLFWFIYLSFLKLLDEDTKARNYYQDDGADLPSMTMCLKWLNKSISNTHPYIADRDLALPNTTNWNFDDYMKKVYLVKNIISKADVQDQPNDKGAYNRISMNLLEHTTDEEIWQESYWAFRNNLMNCVTINSPIQKLLQPSQVQFLLEFNFTKNEVLEFYVEVHPKEQSIMNQNWGLDNLLFFNNEGGNWELYTYKAAIDKHLSTRRFKCNEKNSFKMTQCFNDFYMMKLNCSFPWLKSKKEKYSKCGAEHKVNDLVNLINEINLGAPDVMKEIKDFGCNEQNCQQTNWEMSSWQKVYLKERPGISFLKLTFPSSKKISVMEESFAYTKLDLLADIGGYAGIFIGASILTLYDAALSLLSNVWIYVKSSHSKL